MKDDRDRAGAQRVFTFMTFGWLVIHFVVAANVWGYSYACRAYGNEQAALLSAGMNKVFAPCMYLAYFIAAVALIDLVIVTARGRTILKRREAIFTPLLGSLLSVRSHLCFLQARSRKDFTHSA